MPMSRRHVRPLKRLSDAGSGFGGTAPPVGPMDPYFAQVKLLLHFDGADGSTTFTDSSPSPLTVVPSGDVQLDTADKKFGTASALFDGDGDYLTVDVTSVPKFGVSGVPYTIEMWAYIPNGQTTVMLFSRNGGVNAWGGDDGLQASMYYDGEGQQLVASFRYDDNAVSLVSDGPVENEWFHIAMSYDGTTTRLFINGVQQAATATDPYDQVADADTLEIGRQIAGLYFERYIDEFRITQGTNGARYTANFTPPSAAFPNQ